MFDIQKKDQERQQDSCQLQERRRGAFRNSLMTHKAQAHAHEHTQQHQIGKVPHVPDISC